MHVLLRELPQTRDIQLSAAFVGHTLSGMTMRDALDAPANDPDAGEASVHLDLYDDEDNVFARGWMRGWFAVACSRCIEPVRVPLDEQLAVTYVPASQLPEDLGDDDALEPSNEPDSPQDEESLERQLAEGDIDLYGYEGEKVDLEPLLREQLMLAVPFAPLCSDACKGLCSQCGADLNRTPCSCEPIIDPRLAALKQIKL